MLISQLLHHQFVHPCDTAIIPTAIQETLALADLNDLTGLAIAKD